MTDLLGLLTIAIFGLCSLKKPHLAILLVVWVEAYKPQESSFGLLGSLPVSMIAFSILLVVMLFNMAKLTVPKSGLYHFVFIGMLLSLTLSNAFALFPVPADIKFKDVFNTLLPIYFIPFLVDDRKKLEELLWVIMISLGTLGFFGGAKSVLGGGGYGVALIDASLWREGSIYTNQMLATIPLSLWLANCSAIAKRNKYAKWLAYMYGFFAFATLIGTQARSGLVCTFILLFFVFFTTKHKFKMLISTFVLMLVLIPLVPESWYERMSTLSGSESIQQESSAMGRIAVWRWGIEKIAERPLIGWGFHSYLANAGQLNKYVKGNETTVSNNATAYHNNLFEVTASNGIFGLSLYLSMLSFILFKGRKLSKLPHVTPDIRLLCKGCYVSMLVYSAGGMFVAYAYYPWQYYLFCTVMIVNLHLSNRPEDYSSERMLGTKATRT